MMTTTRGKCLGALALAIAVTGCGESVPVGGLTNPNPGSVVDRDKGAVRSDLPIPDTNAGKEPIITDSAASKDGAMEADLRSKSPPVPAATPLAKENAGSAAGATKPAAPTKDGTPRSPQ